MSDAIQKLLDEVFCESCGQTVKIKAEVCPKCGVRRSIPINNDKNKTTAGIFALFLGGLGAHKFYLGKSGMGILYILFCWTFIPSIVGWIEGISYLVMDDQKFERVHLS